MIIEGSFRVEVKLLEAINGHSYLVLLSIAAGFVEGLQEREKPVVTIDE